MSTSTLSVVTLGCLAAIGFAVVGAAYALEPAPTPTPVMKGDRLGEATAVNDMVTIEEVNPHTGVSNLILLPANAVSG